MSFDFFTAPGDEDSVEGENPSLINRDDVYSRILRTLRLFHESIPDNNAPSSSRSWFVPLNPHKLSEWPTENKNRYLSWLSQVADADEYYSVARTTHSSGPTRYVRREDFIKNPALQKYLMADFCSVISHLLAKHLRAKGHFAEIKACRFVPNPRYEFPLMRNPEETGSKTLHTMKYDERFGYFVNHMIVVVDNEWAYDFLGATFANDTASKDYRGEKWRYQERHEHGAGTGVYLNYAPSAGKRENDISKSMTVRQFLPLSGTHDESVYTEELVDKLKKIWDLEER